MGLDRCKETNDCPNAGYAVIQQYTGISRLSWRPTIGYPSIAPQPQLSPFLAPVIIHLTIYPQPFMSFPISIATAPLFCFLYIDSSSFYPLTPLNLSCPVRVCIFSTMSAFLPVPTLPVTKRPNRSRPPLVCSQCVEERRPSKPRQLSDEAREKISNTMKGRTISASHRARISASLSGANNPRYGRKLSEETRARIGRSVAAASARRRGMKQKQQAEQQQVVIVPEVEKKLRIKAASSKLFGLSNDMSAITARFDGRNHGDVDAMLQHIRDGKNPPDKVRRLMKNSIIARKRTASQTKTPTDTRCGCCNGDGRVQCHSCVGAFGTVSSRCTRCHGAGVLFCDFCLGTGSNSIQL